MVVFKWNKFTSNRPIWPTFNSKQWVSMITHVIRTKRTSWLEWANSVQVKPVWDYEFDHTGSYILMEAAIGVSQTHRRHVWRLVLKRRVQYVNDVTYFVVVKQIVSPNCLTCRFTWIRGVVRGWAWRAIWARITFWSRKNGVNFVRNTLIRIRNTSICTRSRVLNRSKPAIA